MTSLGTLRKTHLFPPTPAFWVISGKVDFVTTLWWPVTKITRASLRGGPQTLRIAGADGKNQQDLYSGLADVAFSEDGATIQLSRWLTQLQGESIFIDYHAGLDAFPDDLKEVFYQLCRLIAIENDRIGKKSEHMDVASTEFIRDLPQWARMVLDAYRRVEAMYV